MKWYRYYQTDSKSRWVKADCKKPPAGAKFSTILMINKNDKSYYGPLYLDFDYKPDENETEKEAEKRINAVLDEVRVAINILCQNYDVDQNDIFLWFTGSAGFHLLIPPQVFGAEAHAHLPRIYKKLVDKIFPESVFKYIDRRVYSEGKGRMWRIQNIRRDNGLYLSLIHI